MAAGEGKPFPWQTEIIGPAAAEPEMSAFVTCILRSVTNTLTQTSVWFHNVDLCDELHFSNSLLVLRILSMHEGNLVHSLGQSHSFFSPDVQSIKIRNEPACFCSPIS